MFPASFLGLMVSSLSVNQRSPRVQCLLSLFLFFYSFLCPFHHQTVSQKYSLEVHGPRSPFTIHFYIFLLQNIKTLATSMQNIQTHHSWRITTGTAYLKGSNGVLIMFMYHIYFLFMYNGLLCVLYTYPSLCTHIRKLLLLVRKVNTLHLHSFTDMTLYSLIRKRKFNWIVTEWILAGQG